MRLLRGSLCKLPENCIPQTRRGWCIYRRKAEEVYANCLFGIPYLSTVAQAKPEYVRPVKDYSFSTAPCHNDTLYRHQLSYLNGGGGNGKTTRAIELFRQRDPLVFTRIHRLAKEMRKKRKQGLDLSQLLRMKWPGWDGSEVHPPHVIDCDEVCTVPRPILETFLGWLDQRGVQVICFVVVITTK